MIMLIMLIIMIMPKEDFVRGRHHIGGCVRDSDVVSGIGVSFVNVNSIEWTNQPRRYFNRVERQFTERFRLEYHFAIFENELLAVVHVILELFEFDVELGLDLLGANERATHLLIFNRKLPQIAASFFEKLGGLAFG